MMNDDVVVVDMFQCPVCGRSVQHDGRSAHYMRHVERGEMARQRNPQTGEVAYLYQAAALLAALPEVGR